MGNNMTGTRRVTEAFPWAPIGLMVDTDPTTFGPGAAALAEATGLHFSTIYRYRSDGRIPWKEADRIAVALGFHPGAIWPEWWAVT